MFTESLIVHTPPYSRMEEPEDQELRHSTFPLYFNDFQPNKIEHTTYSSGILTNIDIRKQPPHMRQKLLLGAEHHLYINGHHIITIPRALLQAAATHLTPTTGADITELPPDTSPHGVSILLQHLLNIAHSTSPSQPLPTNLPVYDSLAVCQAAKTLGLTRYTAHLFRTLAVHYSSCIPPYADLDALLRFSAAHPRLWGEMVRNLAAAVRGEWIVDVDVFAQFCFERPVLNEAIVRGVEALDEMEGRARGWTEERARKGAEEWERRARWLAGRKGEGVRGEKDQERGRGQEEHGLGREQMVARKKAMDTRTVEARKRTAHASAMRSACLAKTRASGKDRVMTGDERNWYVKEFGKQPPRGC